MLTNDLWENNFNFQSNEISLKRKNELKLNFLTIFFIKTVLQAIFNNNS